MNLAPRQIERFLAALTALTRQHGIVMSGPQMELYALTDGQRERSERYTLDPASGSVELPLHATDQPLDRAADLMEGAADGPQMLYGATFTTTLVHAGYQTDAEITAIVGGRARHERFGVSRGLSPEATEQLAQLLRALAMRPELIGAAHAAIAAQDGAQEALTPRFPLTVAGWIDCAADGGRQVLAVRYRMFATDESEAAAAARSAVAQHDPSAVWLEGPRLATAAEEEAEAAARDTDRPGLATLTLIVPPCTEEVTHG